MSSQKKTRKKILQGVVISDKMDKTIQVLVERTVQDPKYKKYVKKRKKFMAHDEKNECRVGDLVEIIESRPLSRHKHFTLNRILKRGEIPMELSPRENQAERGGVNDSK